MKSIMLLVRGHPMNGRRRNPFFVLAVALGLGLFLASQAKAQTFTTLHSFAAGNTNSSGVYTNSDGAGPSGRLVLLDGFLYGTTPVPGGTNGSGTIFKINTDGTRFTNLYTFTATVGNTGSSGRGTNSDGAGSGGLLPLSENAFYGAAGSGGANGNGTVFRINMDGTGFTNLYSLSAGNTNLSGVYTNSDGAGPSVSLILSGDTLYGTAVAGGANGNGAVFKIKSDGTGFTNLYSFSASATNSLGAGTNSDGIGPGVLIASGSILYGTAWQGGSAGGGTVFAVDTDGNSFTNLHNFTGHFSDGIYPTSGVIISGNTLYGTTIEGGGSGGGGTVFSLFTNGTGFTNLHHFTSTNLIVFYPRETNSDGLYPVGGLVLSNATLYGTTIMGGASGSGTVYALNTNGTGFATLHHFDATVGSDGIYHDGTNSDGYNSESTLVLSGDTLYGSAFEGGTGGNGTVFSILFPPQLAITSLGTNVILSWPTNVGGLDYSGYTLQSTTNLIPPTAWTAVSPPSVVVNGANTVSNGISGAMQYYRLIR
jgi:uncharacterized repeat protein (TIGR03803 family)